MRIRRAVFLVTMMLPAIARGEAVLSPPPSRAVLPSDAGWVGILLIGVAAMFVLAAVIGPIVRVLAPDKWREQQ